jgi:tetratricopeptide (TPR) repeat protein
MANALCWNCEFDQALPHFERALELNKAANSLWGISVQKSTIAMNVYAWQGKIGLAYQTSQEALRMAEESGDMLSKATAYTSHGFCCFYRGFLNEAEEYLLKASDSCDRINLLWYGDFANYGLGEVYFDRGEYQKCQDYYGKALSLGERGRLSGSWLSLNRVALARAKVLNNEKDVDLESLYKYEAENKVKLLDGWIPRYIAEILLNIDDKHMSEAEEWVRKAIEAAKRNGVMFVSGSAHSLYAELLKRKGDLPGAKEKLNKAIEIYRECGADGWLKKAQDDLAAIEKPVRKRSRGSGHQK